MTTSSNTLRARCVWSTLLLFVVLLGVLLGLAVVHWLFSPGPFLRPMTMAGHWLRAPGPPGYAGAFRRHIQIPGPVRHAWVSVVARDGFEVCVNQNPVGRLLLWRPTRPFQLGLSEVGQLFTPPAPAMALNFPREYQWTSHRNDWLPTFIDITPHLRPGKNVVAVEVESRRAPAMFRMEGEILLWSGETLRLDSDGDWKAEPAPTFDPRHDWTQTAYRDLAWRAAVDCRIDGTSLPDLHFHTFDERVFTTPFAGHWIRSEVAGADDAVWFETEWDLPGQPDDVWLRLAVNRNVDLFVNEHRVVAPVLGNPDIDTGDWLLGAPRGADLPAAPELLDPDEVGSLFVGDRFESPRHGDPSTLAFKTQEHTLNATRDKARATTRSDLPGTYDPVKEPGEGVMPHEPLPDDPETHSPKALGRNQLIGGLLAYNVRALVRPGRNRIRVRLVPPAAADSLDWAPQFAIDGEARYRDGSRRGFASGPGSHWTVQTQGPSGILGVPFPATVFGPAQVLGKAWPAMLYRGIAHDAGLSWVRKLGCIAAAMLGVTVIATALVATCFARSRGRGLATTAALDDAARTALRMLLPPLAVLFVTQAVFTSWSERHEGILFRLPRLWPTIALATAASPLLVTDWPRRVGRWLRNLPRTPAWPVLVGCLLVAAAVLRIHKLDFQPLDDDEYASCQAVLAIATTGAPGFVPEGVYYTRSPAYHYLVGAVVWLFGPHLWAMRLPSAVFGVATTLLILRFGERLLGHPWVGYGAALFYAIHPFAIFSAHLVRFYQQQQFFSLLCVYFFCRGFVGTPSQAYRYLTVLAFLAAVLSQEITVVLAPLLVLGVLLFARDGGQVCSWRLAVFAGVAMAFIVLDLLVFQTRCLTRTEGVSPTVEATIKPHFWDCYNVATMLVGYSRLHLVASLLLAAALPMLLRRGSRTIWALLFFLASGMVLTNLLVTNVSLRYQYWLIPIWLLLVVEALSMLVQQAAVATRPLTEGIARTRALVPVLAVPLVAGLVLIWAPWRIPGSYDCKLLGDATGAFRFVRSQMRPGDAVAATEPHLHAAFLETGRVTYDLSIPMLYDFLVLQKGRLVDRNGNAELVGSLDDLIAACRRHERLWIVVNREKMRSRSKNLRWEYPAARVELFLRKNCRIVHRTYLWTVFLWDHSEGAFDSFRGS